MEGGVYIYIYVYNMCIQTYVYIYICMCVCVTPCYDSSFRIGKKSTRGRRLVTSLRSLLLGVVELDIGGFAERKIGGGRGEESVLEGWPR